MIDLKEMIVSSVNKHINNNISADDIEIPPDPNLGDYALPCFKLAKECKKSPNETAKVLMDNIQVGDYFSEIKIIGPYLNFFVSSVKLAENILKDVLKKKENYGRGQEKDTTVMIESPGPNTNKPLHLGHVRNMVLGNALVNLYEFSGYDTVRVDIINDRGVHICKSMLAYKKYADNKEPDKKPDHFVGDFYVLFSKRVKQNPELEQEIRDMLVKWENNDKKTRELWKKMNSWAIEGFKETYERFGVEMDKAYPESKHYEKGKKLVLDGLKNGLFEKDEEGNIIIDLEEKNLGKKVVLRADGTSIYITQDLVLADLRYKDYKMDKMIYIVGNEQIYHFKVLFEIFKKLKYPFADDCYHLAYGMIYLPEGKMKSRQGKVVDADNLADEMHKLAKIEVKKRNKNLSEKEIEKRAEQIGMSAIKFYILKYDPMKDFTYNQKESISFEGETGPYIQYTYARIKSILKKYKKNLSKEFNPKLLIKKQEKELIKYLSNFPETVKKSTKEYKPSIISRYLLDLCQSFNNYYHIHRILSEKKELTKSRIILIYAVSIVIKQGLNILGIEALNEM
ncbi:arginine--tRNA ligase [Candidatus Woesearchaeota archaeon]|nr:arginine--tRNA ligase [Candidatus Woesearchaeota archaeon]